MTASQSNIARRIDIALRNLLETLECEGEDAAKVAAKVAIIAGAAFMEDVFGRDETMRTLNAVCEKINGNRMVHIPWHRAGEKASA